MNRQEFLENYHRCCCYVQQLLSQSQGQQGYKFSPGHPEFRELCQTVVGDPEVVQRLRETVFTPDGFHSLIHEAIKKWQKMLLPDSRKRQFCSLDRHPAILSHPAADDFSESISPGDAAPPEICTELRQGIPHDLHDYLDILRKKYPAMLPNTFSRRGRAISFSGEEIEQIAAKLRLLKRFYPDGQVQWFSGRDGQERFDEQQIRKIYVNIFLGLEKNYPAHFLQRDADKRAAVMVRFLILELLNKSPRDILHSADEDFFYRYHLQNVYRYFNYSVNRVMANAFPAEIVPWEGSRSEANYWADQSNRIAAIHWLVERRLARSADTLYMEPLTRDDFTRNGLSYLFNSYYNSVRKALCEAYPNRAPYELGKVPYSYWTEETAAAAIRWMAAKKGWEVSELPRQVRSKALNRKTFSEFGLATLFEKRFSKNIYQAINAAWPGRFQPWELGKVPSAYWRNQEHVYQASEWIALQEGISPEQIPAQIRQGKFNFNRLQKYSIGKALRSWCAGSMERIFAPWFWKEHREFLQEHKLLRKIKRLERSQKKNSLLALLLYGWFYRDVQIGSAQNINQYHRIARRIRQRSVLYPDV